VAAAQVAVMVAELGKVRCRCAAFLSSVHTPHTFLLGGIAAIRRGTSIEATRKGSWR
jgi:hypothetical protein